MAVAFCAWISQVISLINEQSLPLGQQMAELELSKLIHVVEVGQQKFGGSWLFPQDV